MGYTRSYLENQMCVALGGRIAEELIFGADNVTTGASGDFQQVTRTAKMMVTRWGSAMSSARSLTEAEAAQASSGLRRVRTRTTLVRPPTSSTRKSRTWSTEPTGGPRI